MMIEVQARRQSGTMRGGEIRLLYLRALDGREQFGSPMIIHATRIEVGGLRRKTKRRGGSRRY